MNLTPKIERALVYAATAHAGQTRKTVPTPYITHPVSVMLNAASVTDDENILCACLLHDVIEDCDPAQYNEATMRQSFGDATTDMVLVATKDSNIPIWRKRNEAYLQNLATTPLKGALIVSAADKLHNISTLINDYRVMGEDLWSRFHAGRDDQLWWYGAVLAVLQERLPDNQLTIMLDQAVLELNELIIESKLMADIDK